MPPRVLLGDGGCPSGLRARGTALSPVDQGRARRPRAGRHLGLGQAPPCVGSQLQPTHPARAGRIRREPQHPAWCPVQCPHLPPPEAEGGRAFWWRPGQEKVLSRGPGPWSSPGWTSPMGPPRTALPRTGYRSQPCFRTLGHPLAWSWEPTALPAPGPPHTGGGAAVGRPLTHKAYFLPMQQPRVYSTRKQMESR